MLIEHNHINISFSINIKNKDLIKYYLINIYNKINIFNLKWDINYDFCENTSYERLKYYIKKYEYGNKDKNKILLIHKNKEKYIEFIENEKFKVYNIGIIKNNKGNIQIFITSIKQKHKISLINILPTLILLTSKYGYILFLMKIYLDYKVTNINILKIKLLKYLESKSIININYKKNIDISK